MMLVPPRLTRTDTLFPTRRASDLTLAYVDCTLFRDEALVGGGDNFLRHLIAEALLAGATSEKGVFANDQQSFSGGSVFQIVVDSIAEDCNILICDDLGEIGRASCREGVCQYV